MDGGGWAKAAAGGTSEPRRDESIKVRWMSSTASSLTPNRLAGCGTDMTKQRVTGMAGDPNYGAEKQRGGGAKNNNNKKKKSDVCAKGCESLNSWRRRMKTAEYESQCTGAKKREDINKNDKRTEESPNASEIGENKMFYGIHESWRRRVHLRSRC